MTYHALSKWGFRIILVWLPDHVGISGGNEVADAAARDATIQGTLVPCFLSMNFDCPPFMYFGQMATGLGPHPGKEAASCETIFTAMPVFLFLHPV
jgi:hypothetical protein